MRTNLNFSYTSLKDTKTSALHIVQRCKANKLQSLVYLLENKRLGILDFLGADGNLQQQQEEEEEEEDDDDDEEEEEEEEEEEVHLKEMLGPTKFKLRKVVLNRAALEVARKRACSVGGNQGSGYNLGTGDAPTVPSRGSAGAQLGTVQPAVAGGGAVAAERCVWAFRL